MWASEGTTKRKLFKITGYYSELIPYVCCVCNCTQLSTYMLFACTVYDTLLSIAASPCLCCAECGASQAERGELTGSTDVCVQELILRDGTSLSISVEECDMWCRTRGYPVCRRGAGDSEYCYGYREQADGNCGIELKFTSNFWVWQTCVGALFEVEAHLTCTTGTGAIYMHVSALIVHSSISNQNFQK